MVAVDAATPPALTSPPAADKRPPVQLPQALPLVYELPGAAQSMLMRAKELLRENPDPTREQVREGIASQLCRCTGYQFIIDAIMDAAQRMREQGPDLVAAAEPAATVGES